MVESQSRYSIVERLTREKLDIIESTSNIDDDIKIKKQKAEQLKKELEDWEKNIQDQVGRTRREKERNIEEGEMEYSNAIERKESRSRSYERQLEAIDKALERIEEISKTSPTVQQ